MPVILGPRSNMARAKGGWAWAARRDVIRDKRKKKPTFTESKLWLDDFSLFQVLSDFAYFSPEVIRDVSVPTRTHGLRQGTSSSLSRISQVFVISSILFSFSSSEICPNFFLELTWALSEGIVCPWVLQKAINFAPLILIHFFLHKSCKKHWRMCWEENSYISCRTLCLVWIKNCTFMNGIVRFSTWNIYLVKFFLNVFFL